ncbi:hypothetical protein K1T71_002840 [Dendrolimus kikuchii]|uniref:Uncharacterized protein n=1 Tax=Dendrolimus kikuchii TaxID=765133 RepID=A0ACC1DDU7_9NEOP|nr:hypothetical protein K1T71_002840 [Dendrolimus kikuchii]
MPREKSRYRDRDRRSVSYSSDSSYERKKSKSKHRKRSRTRDRSESRNNHRRKRSRSRSRNRRKSYSRSLSRERDRYESKSRRRSSSRSRSKRDRTRSRSSSRSRSKYSKSSKKSSKRSRSSSRSSSFDIEKPLVSNRVILDDTNTKLEKAIKAAEAAGLTLTKIPTYEYKEVIVKEDMPTIHDRNLLSELNSDFFIQKSFTSSRSKKPEQNIVIDLNAQTVKVPESDIKVQKDDSIINFDEIPSAEELREMYHPHINVMDRNQIDNLANSLSHDELLEVTQSTLCTLLSCDPLLNDLPSDIILEEVLAQIAVEHGQSITVFISRDCEQVLKVIIPQSATVRELKKAVRRHFEIYQKRIKNKVKISWKYIWKTYDLSYDSTILDDDDHSIQEYGVCNKVTLGFKKKRKKNKS